MQYCSILVQGSGHMHPVEANAIITKSSVAQETWFPVPGFAMNT